MNSTIDDAKSSTNGEHGVEESLVIWCRQQVASQKVKVANLDVSTFQSGLVFSALVNSLKPGSIDLSKIPTSDPVEILSKTFKLSQTLFAIPQVLDPQALSSGLCDSQMIACALAFFRKYARVSFFLLSSKHVIH